MLSFVNHRNPHTAILPKDIYRIYTFYIKVFKNCADNMLVKLR